MTTTPATPVTPVAGTTAYIVVGGQGAVAVPPGPNGGIIVNPLMPTDQNVPNGEPLYIDPVSNCGQLAANGTIFRLESGQSWEIIAGQTTPTYVNAATSGHKFSVVYW